MKECKCVFVDKREYSGQKVHPKRIVHLGRELSGEFRCHDVQCQFNQKVSHRRLRNEFKFCSSSKQVFRYTAGRNTDVGVSCVNCMPRRRVRRIYLPETGERGVGSADLSTLVEKKIRHLRTSSHRKSVHKMTSSKCVGYCISSVSEKLSPILRTKSGFPIPDVSLDIVRDLIETGNNTEIKLNTTTTQVEEVIGDLPAKQLVKILKSSKSEKRAKAAGDSKALAKDNEECSSDSLLQNIHNLEDADEKNSSIPLNTIEIDLEKEISNTFIGKKDKEQQIIEKSASVLRRRFEALRRLTAKKEDIKKSFVETKTPSTVSVVCSKRDALIASDPSSLDSNSFSSECCPNYSPNPQKLDKERKVENSNEIESRSPPGSPVNGVQSMLKKKLNFADDAASKKTAQRPTVSFKKEKPKESEEIKETEKKQGRKFFYFFKKNFAKSFEKDKSKLCYKPTVLKKGPLTTGRCELKDGLTIKIGAKTPKLDDTAPTPTELSEYGEILRKAWLKRFMAGGPSEAAKNVKIRWNNNTYKPSSSTVCELMDSVYRYNGIVVRSRSEFSNASTQETVNYPQEIQAWMIPLTIVPPPLQGNYCGRTKRLELTLSDRNWLISKCNSPSRNIGVALYPKNLKNDNFRSNSNSVLQIDLPKGFFAEDKSSMDFSHTYSEEKVYNIVEYEHRDMKGFDKDSDLETGDYSLEANVSDRGRCRQVCSKAVKRNIARRDVMTQNSYVLIPKICDVVGLGMITHRDFRQINTIEDMMDDESLTTAYYRQRKYNMNNHYIDDYYQRYLPGSLSMRSCKSDSQLLAFTETNSHVSFYQCYHGDGTKSSKSCPKFYDCETRRQVITSANSLYTLGNVQKLSSCFTSLDTLTMIYRGIIPKDSLEVAKRRRIYACSKQMWAELNFATADQRKRRVLIMDDQISLVPHTVASGILGSLPYKAATEYRTYFENLPATHMEIDTTNGEIRYTQQKQSGAKKCNKPYFPLCETVLDANAYYSDDPMLARQASTKSIDQCSQTVAASGCQCRSRNEQDNPTKPQADEASVCKCRFKNKSKPQCEDDNNPPEKTGSQITTISQRQCKCSARRKSQPGSSLAQSRTRRLSTVPSGQPDMSPTSRAQSYQPQTVSNDCDVPEIKTRAQSRTSHLRTYPSVEPDQPETPPIDCDDSEIKTEDSPALEPDSESVKRPRKRSWLESLRHVSPRTGELCSCEKPKIKSPPAPLSPGARSPSESLSPGSQTPPEPTQPCPPIETNMSGAHLTFQVSPKASPRCSKPMPPAPCCKTSPTNPQIPPKPSPPSPQTPSKPIPTCSKPIPPPPCCKTAPPKPPKKPPCPKKPKPDPCPPKPPEPCPEPGPPPCPPPPPPPPAQSSLSIRTCKCLKKKTSPPQPSPPSPEPIPPCSKNIPPPPCCKPKPPERMPPSPKAPCSEPPPCPEPIPPCSKTIPPPPCCKPKPPEPMPPSPKAPCSEPPPCPEPIPPCSKTISPPPCCKSKPPEPMPPGLQPTPPCCKTIPPPPCCKTQTPNSNSKSPRPKSPDPEFQPKAPICKPKTKPTEKKKPSSCTCANKCPKFSEENRSERKKDKCSSIYSTKSSSVSFSNQVQSESSALCPKPTPICCSHETNSYNPLKSFSRLSPITPFPSCASNKFYKICTTLPSSQDMGSSKPCAEEITSLSDCFFPGRICKVRGGNDEESIHIKISVKPFLEKYLLSLPETRKAQYYVGPGDAEYPTKYPSQNPKKAGSPDRKPHTRPKDNSNCFCAKNEETSTTTKSRESFVLASAATSCQIVPNAYQNNFEQLHNHSVSKINSQIFKENFTMDISEECHVDKVLTKALSRAVMQDQSHNEYLHSSGKIQTIKKTTSVSPDNENSRILGQCRVCDCPPEACKRPPEEKKVKTKGKKSCICSHFTHPASKPCMSVSEASLSNSETCGPEQNQPSGKKSCAAPNCNKTLCKIPICMPDKLLKKTERQNNKRKREQEAKEKAIMAAEKKEMQKKEKEGICAFPWPTNSRLSNQPSLNSVNDFQENPKKPPSGIGPPNREGVSLKQLPDRMKCHQKCEGNVIGKAGPVKVQIGPGDSIKISKIQYPKKFGRKVKENSGIRKCGQEDDLKTPCYERIDYKKESTVHHATAPEFKSNDCKNKNASEDVKSDGSLMNLIEINFHMKFGQNDKNSESQLNKSVSKCKNDQNVYVVEGNHAHEPEKPNKNDVVIKVVIKSFKLKNDRNSNSRHDFNENSSDKNHPIAARYSVENFYLDSHTCDDYRGDVPSRAALTTIILSHLSLNKCDLSDQRKKIKISIPRIAVKSVTQENEGVNCPCLIYEPIIVISEEGQSNQKIDARSEVKSCIDADVNTQSVTSTAEAYAKSANIVPIDDTKSANYDSEEKVIEVKMEPAFSVNDQKSLISIHDEQAKSEIYIPTCDVIEVISIASVSEVPIESDTYIPKDKHISIISFHKVEPAHSTTDYTKSYSYFDDEKADYPTHTTENKSNHKNLNVHVHRDTGNPTIMVPANDKSKIWCSDTSKTSHIRLTLQHDMPLLAQGNASTATIVKSKVSFPEDHEKCLKSILKKSEHSDLSLCPENQTSKQELSADFTNCKSNISYTDVEEPPPTDELYRRNFTSEDEIESDCTNLRQIKEEKKEMLKKVFEKTFNSKKAKNKARMTKLKQMLKAILTSDSSGPEEITLTGHDLVKDVTYTSLKPNYFRDTDSMSNYYKVTEAIKNPSLVYPTIVNSADSSEMGSSGYSDIEKKCICSQMATKLNAGDGCKGVSCQCKNLTNTKTEETNCDLRTENDFFLLNYKTADMQTSSTIPNTLKSNLQPLTDANIQIESSDTKDSKTHSGMKHINNAQKPLAKDPRGLIAFAKDNFKKTRLPRKLFHYSSSQHCDTLLMQAGPNVSGDEDILLIEQPPTKSRREKRRRQNPIVVCQPCDILQTYEAKKAVLEIYAEKTSGSDHLVAKLPKFIFEGSLLATDKNTGDC